MVIADLEWSYTHQRVEVLRGNTEGFQKINLYEY